jgi:hypothetical protein
MFKIEDIVRANTEYKVKFGRPLKKLYITEEQADMIREDAEMLGFMTNRQSIIDRNTMFVDGVELEIVDNDLSMRVDEGGVIAGIGYYNNVHCVQQEPKKGEIWLVDLGEKDLLPVEVLAINEKTVELKPYASMFVTIPSSKYYRKTHVDFVEKLK